MECTRVINIGLGNVRIPTANINSTGCMLGETAKYTASTIVTDISTANANLDGTGTIKKIFTAAVANGTILKRVIIKAQVSLTQGMVRIFIKRGASTAILLEEIEIPIRTRSGIFNSFSKTVELGFNMQSGDDLRISIQNAEKCSIIAEALDWA